MDSPIVEVALEAQKWLAELGSPLPSLSAAQALYVGRLGSHEVRTPSIFGSPSKRGTKACGPRGHERRAAAVAAPRVCRATARRRRGAARCRTISATARALGFINNNQLRARMQKDPVLDALVRNKTGSLCTPIVAAVST